MSAPSPIVPSIPSSSLQATPLPPPEVSDLQPITPSSSSLRAPQTRTASLSVSHAPPTPQYPKPPDVYPPHAVEWKPDMYTGYLNPTLMFTKLPVAAGVLMIRVKMAINLFKTQHFGKPDPYIEVQVGDDIRKTGVATGKDRGDRPRWDTTLQFNLKGGEKRMQVAAWNKRTLGVDLIGQGFVGLAWLLQLARPSVVDEKRAPEESQPRDDGKDPYHEAWFALGRDRMQKTPAGQVLLSAVFYPAPPESQVPTATSIPKEPERKKVDKKYKTQPEELLIDIRRGHNLHPPKRKKGQAPVKIQIFGGELRNAIALSKFRVPKVVHDTIKYLRENALDEVGLFRVPGNNDEVIRLKNSYNAHIDVGFNSPHDAGGVLKLYLRELPEPLIPFSHYEHFLNVDQLHDKAKEMEQYRILISSIPQENRETLRYLLEFLYEVTLHSEANKMDLSNISIVFAPNILRPRVDTTSSAMSDHSRTLRTMQTLIKDHQDLFPKPKEKETKGLSPEARVEKDPLEMDPAALVDLVRQLQEQLAFYEGSEGRGTSLSTDSPVKSKALIASKTLPIHALGLGHGLGGHGPSSRSPITPIEPIPLAPPPDEEPYILTGVDIESSTSPLSLESGTPLSGTPTPLSTSSTPIHLSHSSPVPESSSRQLPPSPLKSSAPPPLPAQGPNPMVRHARGSVAAPLGLGSVLATARLKQPSPTPPSSNPTPPPTLTASPTLGVSQLASTPPLPTAPPPATPPGPPPSMTSVISPIMAPPGARPPPGPPPPTPPPSLPSLPPLPQAPMPPAPVPPPLVSSRH